MHATMTAQGTSHRITGRKYFSWILLFLAFLAADAVMFIYEHQTVATYGITFGKYESLFETITFLLFILFFAAVTWITYRQQAADNNSKDNKLRWTFALLIGFLGIVIYWAAIYTLNWYVIKPLLE